MKVEEHNEGKCLSKEIICCSFMLITLYLTKNVNDIITTPNMLALMTISLQGYHHPSTQCFGKLVPADIIVPVVSASAL